MRCELQNGIVHLVLLYPMRIGFERCYLWLSGLLIIVLVVMLYSMCANGIVV